MRFRFLPWWFAAGTALSIALCASLALAHGNSGVFKDAIDYVPSGGGTYTGDVCLEDNVALELGSACDGSTDADLQWDGDSLNIRGAVECASSLTVAGHTIRSVAAGVAASVTQSQGENPITTDLVEVSTCANSGDVCGTLPAAAAGLTVIVVNNGANGCAVFPASGDDLGQGADTSQTVAASGWSVFRAYDATNWSEQAGGSVADPLTVNGWTPASGTGTVTGDLKLEQQDNEASPSLQFGDGDTGIQEHVDDGLEVVFAGSARWLLNNNRITGTQSGSAAILDEIATTGNPTLIPQNSGLTTGFGGTGAAISHIISGVEQIRTTSGSTQFQGAHTLSTSTGDLIIDPAGSIDTNGSLHYVDADGDTFWNYGADDQIVVAFPTGNWTWVGATLTAGVGGRLINEAGSRTNPTISPTNNSTLGFGSDGFNEFSGIVAGKEYTRWDSTTNPDRFMIAGDVVLDLSADANLTADATPAQGDLPITETVNEFGTVAADDNSTTLPTAAEGRFVYVLNNGANRVQVYPAASDDVEGLATNASTTVAAGENALFVAYDATSWERVTYPRKAYASMWFHGAETETTISAQDQLTKIATFANDGHADRHGLVVPDSTTGNDLTISTGGAGRYRVALQSSFKTNGGASRQLYVSPCIDLASTKTITDCTNATPIVVTSAAHGLLDGDVVTISGVGGNTNCNGDFIIDNVATNTFELNDFGMANIAGSGAYTTGGTVDRHCPGQCSLERIVSNSDLGRGACEAMVTLADGDTISAYVANADSATDDFLTTQISLVAERVD